MAAFWRYVDQRFKATEQAYWFVIALEAEKASPAGAAGNAALRTADEPTHAGGVVFRRNEGRIEFLLVKANSKPSSWVLPKGHIEAGESAEETAVREVREESGAWARVLGPLPPGKPYQVRGETVRVQFYLMECLAEEEPDEEEREHRWFDYETAHGRVPEEAKGVLEEARERI